MKKFNIFSKKTVLATMIVASFTINARETQGVVKRNSSSQKVLAGCSAAQAVAELTINNVRAVIYSGSDMWWDLFTTGNAWYCVPKVADKSKFVNSTFAGNVWFGGVDDNNNLKVAAQTYRQGGIDFWTGPLNIVDATVDASTCLKYDKIFHLTSKEVKDFVLGGYSAALLTPDIANWPAMGDGSLNQDPNLAPWVDKNGVPNGDGDYKPLEGDYPYYDVYGILNKDGLGQCKAKVYGDETLWWVYNDKGSNHQATGGQPIGLEVRAQAFAFKTTNEINNMTFYNYQIINRSTSRINQSYMTVWTDADLGYYKDDVIGCDVKRGLGFIYNGDSNDESIAGTNGYGSLIPALGCDFFQGPINTLDTIDNDHDGLIDEQGEQMGMTKFMYFNNNFAGVDLATTDPDNAVEYYNYMRGIWKFGNPLTWGGSGFGGSCVTDFAFPGTTDYPNKNNCSISGENWMDNTTPPGDRRFLQSSGPFILMPGAVNYVTVGMPWARTTSPNSPQSSIPLLQIADDKAQALFDNCFKKISGPDAPEITIQEMNNELILFMSTKINSNNYLYSYEEKDPDIVYNTAHYSVSATSNKYVFEGYTVYQLKNREVSIDNVNDLSLAIPLFQCDLKNNVTRLINYEDILGIGVDIPTVKVDGKNEGIQSTYRFTKDLFSKSSDQKVVNNKEYYFMAVAYAYNEFGKYEADKPWTTFDEPSSEGQKKPYLRGDGIKFALGIPHDPASTSEEFLANSIYGFGPKVTRIEGQGNGGNNLELTQESVDAIVANGNRVDHITYENGRGPVNIKIIDPLNVPNSEFELRFIHRSAVNQQDIREKACLFDKSNYVHKLNTAFGALNGDSVTWVLTNLSNQKTYVPCRSIKIGQESFFNEIGLSVNISQSTEVGAISTPTTSTDKIIQNGDIIDSRMEFSNSSQVWLTGVKDADNSAFHGKNWIRSGGFSNSADLTVANRNDYKYAAGADEFLDPTSQFEKVLDGTWAPYCLTAATKLKGDPDGEVSAAPAFNYMTLAVTGGSGSPSQAYLNQAPFYDIRGLASVNIVLTKDQTKWTRALVLEENDYKTENPSGAGKLEPRRHRSVDKNGIALGDAGCNTADASVDSIPGQPFQYGLSWFPGYAINLETGERLNIAFGEDSYQGKNNLNMNNNGDDMMWNPTSIETTSNYNGFDTLHPYPYQFGGRHYIYVFGNNRSSTLYGNYTSASTSFAANKKVSPGTYADFANLAFLYTNAYKNFKTGTTAVSFNLNPAGSGKNVLNNLWSDAMWVNIPLLTKSAYAFTNPVNMPCDVTVKLRVKKSYEYGLAGNSVVSNGTAVSNTVSLSSGVISAAPVMPISMNYSVTSPGYYLKTLTTDTAQTNLNNNFGLYKFNTSDVYSLARTAGDAKNALDLINVVPNPYYGYSKYEQNRAENVIRLTNMPNVCKVRIYTLNGTLIRTFDRDVSGQYNANITRTGSEYIESARKSYLEWDLKNQSGISVASGLYIIHIDVPGVGEKILKWFGVMRPLDLENY